MGAACTREEGAAGQGEGEAIAEAALAAHTPPSQGSGNPMMMVLFGGIGAGKSTAAEVAMRAVGMEAANFVGVGVDDLIEYVPEYVSDVESGDAERIKAAYMKYRDVARAAVEPAITKAVKNKYNLLLEWTNEANLKVTRADTVCAAHYVRGGLNPLSAAAKGLCLLSSREQGQEPTS
eukprot:COSAG01_NODE_245_length_20483_cov_32.975314_3_plen_178_part_00